MYQFKRAIPLTFIVCAATALAQSDEARRQWPQWRGPLATGVAPEADPPLEWGETKNIKWKVKVPGFGTSTPIVWGDKVFILTAVKLSKPGQSPATESSALDSDPWLAERERERLAGYGAERPVLLAQANPQPEGGPPGRRPGGGGGFGRSERPTENYKFTVICYDRQTGKPLWQKVAREEIPHEGHHRDHGFASASPVTDGERLFVHFGSRGTYCFDLQARRIWERDLGDMRTRTLRQIMHGVTANLPADLADPLPIYLRRKYRLLPRGAALARVHFPILSGSTRDARAGEIEALNNRLSPAHRRLIFEELFQLRSACR